MVTIEINGTSFDVDKDKTLLEAAMENSIDIPTLCHHKALPTYGACRLCVVEVLRDGWSQIATACTLPVKEGLKVLTDSERVNKSRKMTVELLLARCPEEEVLLELAGKFGISEPRFKQKDDNCIFCGLCVRMCERMGIQAINFTGRGMDRELGTPYMENSDVCMTCGACAFVCPTTRFTPKKVERISGNAPIPIPSEFNEGLNSRPAIYISFPQAVPKVPVIDREHCVYFQTGKCRTCEAICEAEAINYDQEDEIVKLDVGSIIVATGFKAFDPTRKPEYGYGKYPNVYTALEVERLLNASGPTEGHVVLRNGTEPKTVGIVHCIGSRDENTNRYCSRVCCMYSMKLAHLLKEHTGAEIINFYIDIRSPGKAFEEFYNRVAEEGVRFFRGKVADVYPEEPDGSSDRLILVAENTLIGRVQKTPVDMLVLSTGLEPQSDAQALRRLFNISCSEDGFFMERHPKLAPVSTFTDGVFLAGCCQGPKDIPDTVAQAGAAAAEVLALIDKGEVEMEANISYVREDLCSGCQTCIAVCPYTAITFDEEKGVSVINEALCKGCGLCAAVCPSGAIGQHLFEDAQIISEIKGILLREG